MTGTELVVKDAIIVSNSSGIYESNRCLWYRERMVADATITNTCVHELADGTHSIELLITRADGGGEYVVTITGSDLEDQKRINSLGTSVARCSFNFASKDGSLAALKAHLQAQPGNSNIVVDVALTGFHERYNCWFGDGGVIDARGCFYGWKAAGVSCATRTMGSKRYTKKLFSIKRDRFGTDMPALEMPTTFESPSHELKGDDLFFTSGAAMPRKVEPTDIAIDPAFDPAMEKLRDDVRSLLAIWKRNTGDNAGAICMGYMAACAVRHVLIQKERNFPHLYISGRWSYGKDTMADILAVATGMPSNNVISAGKTTTEKLMRNKLAQVGNMPLWVNELRAENADTLLTQIRTSYDIQGAGVTNIKQEQVLFQVNRPFLLVGEVQVGRDAEYSRYVSLVISRPPVDRTLLRAIKVEAARVGRGWTSVLQDHNRAGWQIAQCVEQLRPIFIEIGCDSRRARGWALAGAGLAYLLNPDCHLGAVATLEMPDSNGGTILDELKKRASDAMNTAEEEGMGSRFWEMAQSMRAVGELSNAGSGRWAKYAWRTDQIAIWTGHLVLLLAQRDKTMNDKRGLIYNELKSDPGYIGKRTIRCGGELRKCAIFDGKSSRIPGWVRALAKEAHAVDDAVVDDTPAEEEDDSAVF